MEEAEEKDLNTEEETTSAETGQAAKETETVTPTTEESAVDVAALQAELDKVKRDRDNYREGLLKAKKSLEPETETKEKPAKETAVENVVRKELEQRTEKDALDLFKEKYPALEDEARFNAVIANLPSNVDKSSVKGVLKALEGALVLTQHYSGKKRADGSVDLSEFQTVGKRGSKSAKDDTPEVAESTVAMGTKFRHTADQLAKEDNGPAEVKIA